MKKIFTIFILFTSCAFSREKLYFTRNDGQIDTKDKADCRFYTNVGGGSYFFCADGVTMDFQKVVGGRLPVVGDDQQALPFAQADNRLPSTDYQVQGHVLKLNFVGRTNFVAEITGDDEQEYKCNYFIGNVKEKWHTNVPNYRGITYKNVWEGIDVEYYGATQTTPLLTKEGLGMVENHPDHPRPLLNKEESQLKYDVIVSPGADPNKIQFSYEGDEGISLNNDGALVTKTSLGDVIEQKPYVYQIIDGEKKEIQSKFIVARPVLVASTTAHATISFSLGKYDHTAPLIIDPVYSTYLGGSANDQGMKIVCDEYGYAYITGYTSSYNYPLTPGAYVSFKGGFSNLFITKLKPNGDGLVFSSIIGGTTVESHSQSIAIDKFHNVAIAGNSQTDDYPVFNAFQKTRTLSAGTTQSSDAIITILDSTGSALVYSTYIGGGILMKHGILTLTISENSM